MQGSIFFLFFEHGFDFLSALPDAPKPFYHLRLLLSFYDQLRYRRLIVKVLKRAKLRHHLLMAARNVTNTSRPQESPIKP